MPDYCPECEKQRILYGFCLQVGGQYMTKVNEIMACCAVPTTVTAFDTLTVTFTYKGEEYKMNKKEFLAKSWRKYDSY